MKPLRSIIVLTAKSLRTPFQISTRNLRTTPPLSRSSASQAWSLYEPLIQAPKQNDPPPPPPPETPSGEASKSRLKEFNVGDFILRKGSGKFKPLYVCSSCGKSDDHRWAVCRSCYAPGTMAEFPGESKLAGDSLPVRLRDVHRGISPQDWRISLPGLLGAEINRVLGGGLVPGSVVLIGGDPGIGKSTLLLQIAALISGAFEPDKAAPVMYVSGEESIEQIGLRANRLGIVREELFLYSSTNVEDLIHQTQLISPRALVIDSIQTVYLSNVSGTAGGLSQVKECTMSLLRYAKKTGIPVLLVGHVTKNGDLAGPRVLEHIVDVVLYMEGEKWSARRLLRSVKNRFGSTDELGVFEMSQKGLEAVVNSSKMFLSEEYSSSEILAGLAVAVIMDGSRTFLIEIQALCVSGSTVSRQVNGVQGNRADMIISILIKQAGLKLQQNAIFLNVVSGISLTETAGDVAIAAAICSSFLESPIPSDIAFIGEIGLGGELRMVPRMEKRIQTVAKLGYRKCIVPKSAEKIATTSNAGGMKVVGCRNLKEVINNVFVSQGTT